MSQPTKVKFGNGGQKLVLEIFDFWGVGSWVKKNFLRSGKIRWSGGSGSIFWGVGQAKMVSLTRSG